MVPPPADLYQPAAHAEQPHHDNHSQVLNLTWNLLLASYLAPCLRLTSRSAVLSAPLVCLSVASVHLYTVLEGQNKLSDHCMQQVTDSSIELAERQLSARSADLHAPHEVAQSALSRMGSMQGQVSKFHGCFQRTSSNVKCPGLCLKPLREVKLQSHISWYICRTSLLALVKSMLC